MSDRRGSAGEIHVALALLLLSPYNQMRHMTRQNLRRIWTNETNERNPECQGTSTYSKGRS